MKYQNKSYRNIGILTLVFVFLALGFIGDSSNAQTKKNAKSTSTPKSKSKATPTPKKAKATPGKSKSNQKTTAKTKPTPTPNKNTKSKTVATKDKNSKSKTSDKNSKSKTSSSNKTSLNNKNSSKSSKTNDKKTTPTKKKTQTASTKTTTKNTKPTVQKTRTQTPVKQTKTTTTVQPNKELPQIVVSSLSTSVRTTPNLTASEVSRAKLGSIYKVVDKNTGWYKVQISNRGATSVGWIPVTAATNLETSGNEEIYRQILTKNYKSEKMNFAEAAEVYDFLTRVQPEIKNENAAADFGLKRLMALRAALDAIPVEQKDQKIYQDFIKAQDQNIVYSEPAGEWYVRAPLFWDLHSKYTALPVGEKIAWQAAKNPLPGECEGYVNCYLFLLRMTDGEYLNFYPSGEHAIEALTNITKLLDPIAADANSKTIYNGPSDVSDRAEFNSLITELRVIVSRLPNTEKDKALQQLRKIAEGFK